MIPPLLFPHKVVLNLSTTLPLLICDGRAAILGVQRSLSHPPNFIMAIILTLLLLSNSKTNLGPYVTLSTRKTIDSALMSTITGSCQINAVRSWQSHMLLFVEVTATKSSKNQLLYEHSIRATNVNIHIGQCPMTIQIFIISCSSLFNFFCRVPQHKITIADAK
ncbi:hypothetical protein T08_13550, partial [Trichinella sp. T8]